jgi:hypothetical protein
MNIGKLNLNDIVKISFDSVKIKFIATGLFLAMVLSILSGYLATFLFNKSVSMGWIKTLDIGTAIVAGLIVFYTVVGATFLTKQSLGKTKSKLDLGKQIKAIFWKALGVVIVYLLSLGLIAAAAAIIGQLVRIPYVGLYLMALLSVPAFIAFAFLIVYATITGKLLVAALVEQSNKSVTTIVKNLITLTIRQPKKILYNGFLSLVAIIPMLLSVALIFIAAYFLYILFGWQLSGLGSILGLYLQSGVGFVYFILSISASFVLSYLFAHVCALAVVILYSIYLDAQ